MNNYAQLLPFIEPANYNISIDIDFKNAEFKGELHLKAHNKRMTNTLRLHSKGLEITEARAETDNGVYETKSIDYDNDNQQVLLRFSEEIPDGAVTLHFRYHGKCSNDMLGFYRSKYSHNEKIEQVLSTQLESHYARRVFPCIDEPAAKATFDLQLSVNNKDVDVIGNTAVKKSTQTESKQIVTFETTPLMSTYLLAWAVGNFDYLEATSKSGALIRTYATPHNVEKTRFVLEISKKILDYYEDYFDITYPLKKLDLIGIPEFSAGAMENWGLVTFREEAFLVDKEHTSVSTKQFVATVVAHELAHQWFGNLVTMSWWNDLWLNEGFASWVEYLAVDHIFPEWDMWTEFVSSDWDTALQLDSLWNTHPIEVPIQNPDEINEIFDAISYQKGAAAIRMLHDFVGDKAFQAGLHNYLDQHSYANTVTDDLWRALEDASGKPVKEFMHRWTRQAGFPLLSYERDEDGLTVHQRRFIMSPRERTKQSDDTKWPIQLTSVKDNKLYLTQSKQYWNVNNENSPKFNHKQVGLYRVKYSHDDIFTLSNQIKGGALETTERIGVLSDIFAVTRAGYNDLDTFFSLLQSYKHEENHIAWDVISYCMNITWRTFDDSESRDSLLHVFQEVLNDKYTQTSWEARKTDSHSERLLRSTILALSMKFDVQEARSKALELFNTSFDESSIHPDIRRSVYVAVARERGAEVHSKFLEAYRSETSYEERGRLSNALAAIEDVSVVKDNLALLKTEQVRLQEAIYWLAFLLNNHVAKDLTWEWIKENWGWLQDKFGAGTSMSSIPKLIGRVFSEQENINDMEDFFVKAETGNIERSVKQSIEVAYTNLEWKKREKLKS